ncbi:MAG: glycosyltransferase family 9 protein [Chitinophagales bacterium]
MAKFLLIRFSSIGDIVLTTPVIRCLKKQVDGAEVHFLTKDSFRSVVEHNPFIDKLHVLAHSRELMIHELKEENYDYVIDLHHNVRTLGVKKELAKKSFSFYKLNIEKYIYTSLKLNVLPKVHIVDRYLATLKSFGVKNDGAGLDYFISSKDETHKQDIPASHHAGYIACVIGAAHGTKKWPVNKWKEFATQMDHPLIILGGNDDAENGKEIASADPVKIYNACGKFSINESADLIRKAKIVVTHDTGLMHIAAAYKRPIVSLWGNTVPSFGMYPYYGTNPVGGSNPDGGNKPYDILQVNKLRCRPCSKIGYDKCPLGHFKCMQKIEVDDVLAAVKKRL